MPDQTVTEKVSSDITVMTLVTAIVGAFGAFAIFQPKLAISAAMKRETGFVEPAFRMLYVIPQYLSALTIVGFCVLLVAAFIHSIRPDVFAHSHFLTNVGSFFILGNVVWIVFLAAVIGAIVQFNLLSWVLLIVSAVASFLPIPLLRGAFGRYGQSAGWLQAWSICRAWDKGQPLLLSRPEIERLGDSVLFRLANPALGSNDFAETPISATLDARANIALFGCILEATHYAQDWKAPSWSEFYAALAAIHDQTKMFDPSELQKLGFSNEFVEQFRARLVAEIKSRAQLCPPDNYLAAAGHLSTTWNALHRHAGSVLNLIPFWAPLLGGRLYWLDQRLKRLPMLNSEGMRPQLIKLLARWGTLPWAKAAVFVQPFAKRQGWLLLQENALRVFPVQNDVTFFDVGDVQLTRIACLKISREVEKKVRALQSKGSARRERNVSDAMGAVRGGRFCALGSGRRSHGKRAQ